MNKKLFFGLLLGIMYSCSNSDEQFVQPSNPEDEEVAVVFNISPYTMEPMYAQSRSNRTTWIMKTITVDEDGGTYELSLDRAAAKFRLEITDRYS